MAVLHPKWQVIAIGLVASGRFPRQETNRPFGITTTEHMAYDLRDVGPYLKSVRVLKQVYKAKGPVKCGCGVPGEVRTGCCIH